MSEREIRVMIVDDHVLVREGLRQLLELGKGIRVIAEASDGMECMRKLETVRPDLVFLDIRMPGISGIVTTRLITERYPQLKVIMLTIYDDDQYVTEAIRAGAKGYVLKDVKRGNLLQIVEHVMEDRAFLDPNVTRKLFERLKGGDAGGIDAGGDLRPHLTQRELEVLILVVAGRRDRDIAGELFISENTVRSHLKSLYRKLAVTTRAQAVARALELGLVSRPKLARS